MNHISLILVLCFVLVNTAGWATTNNVGYDGLWFMGFNLHKDVFQGDKGLMVRQAMSMAINQKKMSRSVLQEKKIPDSYIPLGMEGYKSEIVSTYDVVAAKQVMFAAGYNMSDPRIKNIRLLHTEGAMTKRIAEWVKDDLKHIGVRVELVSVSYAQHSTWENLLKKGESHLYLMGFKAEDKYDVMSFLKPVFHSNGYANFSFYRNENVDTLINEGAYAINKDIRLQKIGLIHKQLTNDLPLIGLFYIQVL